MTELPLYHKIDSIQKRYVDGPLKHQFTGEWTDPAHLYLAGNDWVCREKIDGTNIRVHLTLSYDTVDGVYSETPRPVVSIGGRTEKADIPKPLLARLESIFRAPEFLGTAAEVFNDSSWLGGIALYGEGFGAGIQKGAAYGPVDFILFDVRVGHMWLKEEAITGIANALGVQRVPIYEDITTLDEAIRVVSSGQLLSHWTAYGEAEGIVAVPTAGLLDRRGRRIIAKVKGVDFPGRHG